MKDCKNDSLENTPVVNRDCKSAKFREGILKKGGLNSDPDPNYRPAPPQSFVAKNNDWQLIDNEFPKCFPKNIVQLWNKSWSKPVVGYYHSPHKWWRGLDRDGWYGVGIPPTHWKPLSDPPEINNE